MNKKYQKPMSQSLGDLALAEGDCVTGGAVGPVCSLGSNYTTCSGGATFAQPVCNLAGNSAANCTAFGSTANPPF
jgi:hypothetical protein